MALLKCKAWAYKTCLAFFYFHSRCTSTHLGTGELWKEILMKYIMHSMKYNLRKRSVKKKIRSTPYSNKSWQWPWDVISFLWGYNLTEILINQIDIVVNSRLHVQFHLLNFMSEKLTQGNAFFKTSFPSAILCTAVYERNITEVEKLLSTVYCVKLYLYLTAAKCGCREKTSILSQWDSPTFSIFNNSLMAPSWEKVEKKEM